MPTSCAASGSLTTASLKGFPRRPALGYDRIRQTVGANVTRYLLDLQPGLALVLAATTGATNNESTEGHTHHYAHSPHGIHAQRDVANNWEWMVQDGLGSVRGVADNNAGVLWGMGYAAYGAPINGVGSAQTMYGFTGEPTDGNGLVHPLARYYNRALAIFPSLDPFEGMAGRPMSLNGYSWLQENTPNAGDPSGLECVSCFIQPGGGQFDPYRFYACRDLKHCVGSEVMLHAGDNVACLERRRSGEAIEIEAVVLMYRPSSM